MAAKRIAAGLLLLSATTASHSEIAPLWSLSWLDSQQSSLVSSATSVNSNSSGAALAAYDVHFAQRDHVRFLLAAADGSLVWVYEDDVPSAAIGAAFRLDGQVVAVSYREGGASGLLSVRLLGATDGSVIWEVTTPLLDNPSAFAYAHRLAIDVNGTSYVVQGDGGDYSILRVDLNGNLLPAWHWSSGSNTASPTDISVLPDGGVVVTGFGDLGGGYRTVRLDPQGAVLFSDIEDGDLGNPLGSSSIIVNADGDFLLAATPESSGGVPRLRVWKLSADGTRLWTVDWGPSNLTNGLQLGGLAMSSDGDAIAAVGLSPGSAADTVGLVRFGGQTGDLRFARFWPNDALQSPRINGIAIATNDRIATSMLSFDGSAHLFEWTHDGRSCRRADPTAIDRTIVSALGQGWVTLSKVVQADQAKIVVERLDANAPCDIDALFHNGFDL